MNIASIVVIAITIICSVLAVLTAEEPLDETFHVEAAMHGLPLQPLATKISSRSDNESSAKTPIKAAVPRSVQTEDIVDARSRKRSDSPRRTEGVRLPHPAQS